MTRFPHWQAKAFKTGRFEAVVKVGGSVVYGPHLAVVAEAVAQAGTRARLLVFPGGGLPDQLFEAMLADGRLSGPALTATSELALDQTALALADRSAGLVAVSSVREAEDIASGTATPVLRPATLLRSVDVFRDTDRVSSDSMAAWLAVLLQVPRVVLVKSTLPEVTTVDGLRGDDLVDEVFPDLVLDHGLRCRICVPDHGRDALVAALTASAGADGSIDLEHR